MGDSSVASSKTTRAVSPSQPQPGNSSTLPLFLNIQSYLGHCHLTGENYLNWSSLFRSVLQTHKITFTITQKNPPSLHLEDGTTPNPDHDLFIQASGLVVGWMKAAVSDKIQPRVNSCVRSFEAREILAKCFGGSSHIHIQKLQDDLNTLKQTSDMSIDDYLLKAITLVDSLTKAGEIVSKEDLQRRILAGLGPSYKEFITSQNNKLAVSIDKLQDLLLQEEALQLKFSSLSLHPTTTLTVTSGPNRQNSHQQSNSTPQLSNQSGVIFSHQNPGSNMFHN